MLNQFLVLVLLNFIASKVVHILFQVIVPVGDILRTLCTFGKIAKSVENEEYHECH
jgi:hypothetical protein